MSRRDGVLRPFARYLDGDPEVWVLCLIDEVQHDVPPPESRHRVLGVPDGRCLEVKLTALTDDEEVRSPRGRRAIALRA